MIKVLYLIGLLVFVGIIVGVASFVNSKLAAVIVGGIVFGLAVMILDLDLGINIIRLCGLALWRYWLVQYVKLCGNKI